MKKITLFFTMLFLFTLSWQGMAQFTESFDTEIPATWTVVDVDGGDGWVHSTTDPHSGAGQVSIKWDSNAHDDYLISPSFTVTAGTSDQVSFYAGIDGATWTETFDVMLSTTAGNTAADFDVTLASETATSAAPNHDLFSYDLTTYVGQTVTIAIRATDTNRFYLYIDDFTVNTPPACADATNLAAANFTPGNADLTWDAEAAATGYNWEIQPQGTAQGDAALVEGGAVATNAATATALISGTDYTLYVQSDCGASGTANYVSYDFTYILPPANDDCANPTTLTLDLGTSCGASAITGISNDGSTDSGEATPSCGSYGSDTTSGDMWYSVTIPAGVSAVTFNVENITGMTSVAGAFYSGSCGSLTEIDCTQFGSGWPWELSGLTSGSTYLLRVWDYGLDEVGTFDLCGYYITCGAPTALASDTITETSANVTWTDGIGIVANNTVTVTPAIAGSPFTVAAGTETLALTGLTVATSYTVEIANDCGANPSATTIVYTGHCIPTASSATMTTFIDNFSTTNGIANISNLATGQSPANYGDFSAMSVSATAGDSFDFNVEIQDGTLGCAIWVDWNNDLLFDTATETVFNTTSYGNGPFTGTITVPAGTTDGDYRMRLMVDWSDNNPDDDACAMIRGEVEDYTLTVVPYVAVVPLNDDCATPEALTVYASGASAGNETTGDSTLATASAQALTSCDAIGINFDMFYEFTVPAGQTEVYVLSGGDTGGNIEVALFDACGGTEVAGSCSNNGTEHVISGLTGGTTYLLQVWHDDFNAGLFTIAVEEAPTCPRPNTFSLANLTETSVDIIWAAGGVETMWDFEYDVTGFTQGTGTMITETTMNTGLNLTPLTQGTQYDIYVRAVCVSGTDNSTWVGPLTFTTLFTPPTNDDCATPEALTVYASGASAGNETPANSSGATASAQALTTCDGTGINLDMFYEFTVPVGETEVYVLSGGDTGGNIEVALFDACGGTEVAGSCSNNGTQHIISGLTGGTTYLLQVWHDDFNAGTFTVAVEEAPTCPTPSGFSLANLTTTSVDVLWDAGGTETMWDFEYGVTGFTQGTGTMITETTLNTGLTLTPLTDSTTYDIYVRAVCVSGSDNSTWVGPLNFTTPAPPPANDACADAIAIACSDVVAGSTTSATSEVIGSFTGAQEDANSVWYVFTGNGDAVTLSTCNDTGVTPGDAAYDTKIDVYSSPTDCTTLTHIGGSDDGGTCTGFSSLFEFNSATGTNYYVRVYGYNVNNSGDFNLSVECQAPCTPVETNQDCASATTLVRNGASVTFDSTCSTTNIANPTCDLFGTIADLWFETTASGNGLLDITTTLGTATEINVAVYEGTCGSLTEVATACADTPDVANALALTGLTPNGTYFVQTWTSGEAQEGTFDIVVGSSTVGVDDLQSVGFNYYPNPVTNELHVTANENIASVVIYNMLGQEVQRISPSALDATIDMSNLAIGNYYAKAQVGDKVGTFNIIKK